MKGEAFWKEHLRENAAAAAAAAAAVAEHLEKSLRLCCEMNAAGNNNFGKYTCSLPMLMPYSMLVP